MYYIFFIYSSVYGRLGCFHDLAKHNNPKPMGYSKSSSKKEIYNNAILPQGTRKISNKQPNLTPKETRERRSTTPT